MKTVKTCSFPQKSAMTMQKEHVFEEYVLVLHYLWLSEQVSSDFVLIFGDEGIIVSCNT